MAITVQNSPASYTSAHDALWHVVSSNNSSQTNFKYVFDILVNSTVVATVKNFPDSGGYGVFDAGAIVRNYITSGFSSSGASLLQYSDSFLHVDYTINFGEEYGGTTYTNLTSGNYKGWNYSLDPFRTSISTYANKFLTSRDRTAGEVMNGEKFIITYFNADSANVTATFQKLTEAGTNDGSSATGAGLGTNHGLILDLSPAAVNAYLGSNFITSSTYAWRITMGGDSMVVKQVCAPKFTPVNIIFQNQFGGYDSLIFRLASRQQKQFNRTTYKSTQYRRVGTAMAFQQTSGVQFGGNQAFSTSIDYSYKVISNYLSVADYNLGSQLLASNEAYYYITQGNDNKFYPIVMRDSSWEGKNFTSDRLFNYELTFDLGNTQYSQYR
jgi:hypothetical protein